MNTVAITAEIHVPILFPKTPYSANTFANRQSVLAFVPVPIVRPLRLVAPTPEKSWGAIQVHTICLQCHQTSFALPHAPQTRSPIMRIPYRYRPHIHTQNPMLLKAHHEIVAKSGKPQEWCDKHSP